MFYVAFGPNKQDFHSLRETFILNLTRFSETGFLSYQLLRIQLVRGPGWNNLLHYQTLIGTKCTKCCNQNDNLATGQRQRKATQLCPDDIFQLYDLS